MKTVQNILKGKTESGTNFIVTVTAKRGYEDVTEKVWVDEYVEITSKKEINETIIETTVNGVVYKGGLYITFSDFHKKQGVYAILGEKIGISKNNYTIIFNFIEGCKKEAETDNDWLNYQKIKDNLVKEEIEYEQHVKRVNEMMTLNGKTF